jgi:hypothetical protein
MNQIRQPHILTCSLPVAEALAFRQLAEEQGVGPSTLLKQGARLVLASHGVGPVAREDGRKTRWQRARAA